MNFYTLGGDWYHKKEDYLKIKDKYAYVKSFFGNRENDFIELKLFSQSDINCFLREFKAAYINPDDAANIPTDFFTFDLYIDAKDIDVLALDIPRCLLLSPKVKDILEQFNLPAQVGFYEVRVRQGKTKIYPYYLLLVLDLPAEPWTIDFSRSFFHEYEFPNILRRNIKVKDLAEYLSYNWRLNTMEDAELYINHYAYQYDLFSLPSPFGGSMTITERLFQALMQAKVTGIADSFKTPIKYLKSV